MGEKREKAWGRHKGKTKDSILTGDRRRKITVP